VLPRPFLRKTNRVEVLWEVCAHSHVTLFPER
jgi:hypothetical protein